MKVRSLQSLATWAEPQAKVGLRSVLSEMNGFHSAPWSISSPRFHWAARMRMERGEVECFVVVAVTDLARRMIGL